MLMVGVILIANYYTRFPSVRKEIECSNSLFSVLTDGKWRWAENGEIQSLISIHMDGNQALNFAIFRPYEHWFSRWRHIIVQSTKRNQL